MLSFCIQNTNSKGESNHHKHSDNFVLQGGPPSFGTVSKLSFSCFVFQSCLHSFPSQPHHFQPVWKSHMEPKREYCYACKHNVSTLVCLLCRRLAYFLLMWFQHSNQWKQSWFPHQEGQLDETISVLRVTGSFCILFATLIYKYRDNISNFQLEY